MKSLRIFLLLAGLLVCGASAQSNDQATNSAAAARRDMFRNATNRFGRSFPTNAAQGAMMGTNGAALTATGVNGAVGAAIDPNAAVGQVPTRTEPAPITFPSFPTPAPTRRERELAAAAAAATNQAGANPAGGIPAGAIPAVGAVGLEGGEEEDGILTFSNATLDQIFEAYQTFSGRTVIRPTSLPGTITINSAKPLNKKESVQALDSVLALNGVIMINLGENLVKAVPVAQADKEGAFLNTNKTSELPDTEQFITKVVTLKTAKPSEIAQTISTFSKSASAVTPIDSNMTLVLRDYSSNIKRMMELIEKIDVLPEKDFKLEVIPIRYGKVTDIYATMSALISGGGGGGGTGFSGTGTGGRNSGMGGFGNTMNRNNNRMGNMGNQYGGNNSSYGNTMNRGGYNNGSIYPQQVAQPSAAGAQGSFNNRLNSIINRATKPEEQQVLENANIVPDERSNKLLIFANKRDMEMITNIVDKVDVLLAQVLIEAVILEVNLDDSLNYGVSAAQRGKQFSESFAGAGASKNPVGSSPGFFGLTNFPSGAPNGFSYFGQIGSSFDVALQAVASNGKANVVSRPRIQTSHAIPGNIFVGETRPYVTGFSDYGGFGSGVATRSTVQEKTIGLTLSVTPYITPDGLVVMELQQQFDRFKDSIIVEGNPYPLVDSRMADSTLTVRDGDLIMLGGLIRESNSRNSSGVPILKDIPGLGALFRSTTKSAQRTELIILMKATVLKSPEAAAFLAAEERATLPGVREAEMEQNLSDEKRNKKIDKKEKNLKGR